jgi:UDPglucose--hexose-1-phosphate uridylyltransferase
MPPRRLFFISQVSAVSRAPIDGQELQDIAMSFMRLDPTTQDWVIFAPSRARRPHDFRRPEFDAGGGSESADECPFCPGNEARTPPEIWRERSAEGQASSWSVRVIPNKFPVFTIEEDPHHYEDGEGLRCMGGCGAHEVIVESPDHSRILAEQSIEQIERVLRTAQSRSLDLLRDRRFQAVVIFKNHGEAAGTSLAHPHWQLIATPVVPRLLRLKHTVATEFFDVSGACVYSVMLRHELSQKSRLVHENEHFVAFLPYASHSPFETWIMPLRRQASFGAVTRDHLRPLAEILKMVLLKLNVGLANPPFNLTIDTATRGDESKEFFLWHMRIVLRLTTPAGFELGSGMAINTVLPEEAAEYLRGVDVSSGPAVAADLRPATPVKVG